MLDDSLFILLHILWALEKLIVGRGCWTCYSLGWRGDCLFVLGLRSHSIALYKGKQTVAGTPISITNTSNVDDQCLHLHGGFGTEGGKINSAAMDHLCDFVPIETTTYSWKCYHAL